MIDPSKTVAIQALLDYLITWSCSCAQESGMRCIMHEAIAAQEELRNRPIPVITTPDAPETFKIAGYASVFGVKDSQKDIMQRGAFTNTLRQDAHHIRFLWHHQHESPIGHINKIGEDDIGLYVECTLLLSLPKARGAYDMIQLGVTDGLSIGYAAVNYKQDNDTGIRTIESCDLFEVSLVTIPANPKARIGTQAVKEEKKKPIICDCCHEVCERTAAHPGRLWNSQAALCKDCWAIWHDDMDVSFSDIQSARFKAIIAAMIAEAIKL